MNLAVAPGAEAVATATTALGTSVDGVVSDSSGVEFEVSPKVAAACLTILLFWNKVFIVPVCANFMKLLAIYSNYGTPKPGFQITVYRDVVDFYFQIIVHRHHTV